MKKYISKALLLALFMILAVGLLPATAQARTVRMEKGQALQLSKSRTGFTWTTENKDMLTVNTYGLAKAKRCGTVRVVGKTKTAEYEFNIIISLPTHSFWTDLKGTPAGTVIPQEEVNFANEAQYFKVYEIDDVIYKRINGKSFNPKGKVKRTDLRYLKVLHYNWNHEIQVGEMIVNKNIADKVCSLLKNMFDREYEINSMYLIEKFWKGTAAKSDFYSCEMNNSSAFCYRTMTGSSTLSKHSYGYAIDINPQQNPYVKKVNGKWTCSWPNARIYMDRSKKYRGMINHSDYAYTIFKKAGFAWGGDWTNPKDYQHFQYK